MDAPLLDPRDDLADRGRAAVLLVGVGVDLLDAVRTVCGVGVAAAEGRDVDPAEALGLVDRVDALAGRDPRAPLEDVEPTRVVGGADFLIPADDPVGVGEALDRRDDKRDRCQDPPGGGGRQLVGSGRKLLDLELLVVGRAKGPHHVRRASRIADQSDPEGKPRPRIRRRARNEVHSRQKVEGVPSEETSRAPGTSHTSRISTTCGGLAASFHTGSRRGSRGPGTSKRKSTASPWISN